MKRLTGIGGIFCKAQDPAALSAWYRDHLGLDVTGWNGVIFTRGGDGSESGMTIWSAFSADTTYMAPGTASSMINFRLPDVSALVSILRPEDCNVVDRTEPSEQGKFGRVIDPEGNKVELWERPAGQ